MSRSKRHDVALLTLITSAMGAGPLFNFGLAATSALVITTFGISSAAFGAILTVVFASAAVASIAFGWLADRLSLRVQFVILFGGAALALVVSGFAPDYTFLLATAVLAGLSQAMSNPTTNRTIRTLATPEQRTGWIGVKQSGVQASQLVAGILFPPLALVFGWHGAALCVSLLCVGLLVATFLVIPAANDEPPTIVPLRTGEVRVGEPERAPWGVIVLLSAVSFLSGFGVQATNAYLALFAVHDFGYGLVLGGALVATSGLIGVASRVWWGRRLARGARAGALLMLLSTGAICAAVLLLLAGLLHASVLLWIAVALHGISVLGANVVVNATVMALVGPGRLGRATGVTASGMYAGFATGPFVVGALVDSTAGFTGGWLAVGAAYVLCLAASAIVLRATRDLT